MACSMSRLYGMTTPTGPGSPARASWNAWRIGVRNLADVLHGEDALGHRLQQGDLVERVDLERAVRVGRWPRRRRCTRSGCCRAAPRRGR